jgi:hypothetical protein
MGGLVKGCVEGRGAQATRVDSVGVGRGEVEGAGQVVAVGGIGEREMLATS